MKLVAILSLLPRLVARAAGSLLRFLHARRRAARTFRRALRNDGLPPEVVSQLTADYRGMVALRRRNRDQRSTGG